MEVRSDEKSASNPVAPLLKYIVTAIAVAMSLFHMYVAGFGPPEAMQFRGIHLMFAFALVFMLYPLQPQGSSLWRLSDWVLLALSLACVAHILFDYDYFTNRIIYIDDLRPIDRFFAVVAVLTVLEGTRRVIGWALPLTAIIFLTYAIFFTQVKIDVLIEQLYNSTEGIFGSTLGFLHPMSCFL